MGSKCSEREKQKKGNSTAKCHFGKYGWYESKLGTPMLDVYIFKILIGVPNTYIYIIIYIIMYIH
jgi:hypothetical protein